MSITSVLLPDIAANRSAFLFSRSSFLPFAASLACRGEWGSRTHPRALALASFQAKCIAQGITASCQLLPASRRALP